MTSSAGATSRSLAGAAWLTRGALPRLLGVLDRNGEEARVVGGAVRNALLGVPIAEVDVATTAVPDEVVKRVTAAGFKPVPTGIEHGTITVVIDKHPFEVTTLRQDVETYGRHAKVAFGRDWKTDAERRDFTINALSATADGTVYDYVGGLADLAARRVRFIGEPKQRIEEDYLRILRFFRFHAAYGTSDHPYAEGIAACIAGRDGLEQLSRERVRAEVLKLVVAPHAVPTLISMADAGLLLRVLGGISYLASFENMAKVEVAIGVAPDPARRLGALGVMVAEHAERLWQRLRLTNAEHERLASMAEGWRRMSPAFGEKAARALLYRLGPEHFTDHALLGWARSNASSNNADWYTLATLPARWTAPVFPLKAADFIKRGIEKGPALGAALAAAETAWIAAGFPGDAAVLEKIADSAPKPPAAR
jgi:poly(A) polymerase